MAFSRTLLAAVVSDAAKRGVRALETFARTEKGSERLETEFRGSEAKRHAGGPLTCLQEDEFFLSRGFEEVGKDPEFPRLRLEIDGEHLWKADVEHALDQLIFEANMRPSAVNKYAKELEVLVNETLDKIITNDRKRKALKQADFGRLLALYVCYIPPLLFPL